MSIIYVNKLWVKYSPVLYPVSRGRPILKPVLQVAYTNQGYLFISFQLIPLQRVYFPPWEYFTYMFPLFLKIILRIFKFTRLVRLAIFGIMMCTHYFSYTVLYNCTQWILDYSILFFIHEFLFREFYYVEYFI